MLKRAAVLVASCGALLTGCGADVQAENQEILSNLLEAGIPEESITVSGEAVYLGHDTHVSLQASRELLQRGPGSQEHYRSANLVGTAVTRICVNTTSTFNSLSRLSQGLDLTLAQYNALGLRLTFVRGPATGCTANIAVATTSGTGYSSGLPSNGYPYGRITVGTGINTYSVDVSEHILTHLIGHTLGFLHTDANDPAISCGLNGSGSADYGSGVGGILIIGSPPPTAGGSLLNTCIPVSTDGEFTSSDRWALSYIY